MEHFLPRLERVLQASGGSPLVEVGDLFLPGVDLQILPDGLEVVQRSSDLCFVSCNGNELRPVLFELLNFAPVASLLSALTIFGCSFGEQDFLALASFVANNTTLTELDVRHNKGGAAMVALAEAVAKSRIKLFAMGNNGMNGACMEALATLLRTQAPLEVLDLSEERLSSASAGTLAAGIAEAVNLRSLSFLRCWLGDEGVADICAAIERRGRVISLDVADCDFTLAGVRPVARLLRRDLLLRLEVNHDQFRDEGAAVLAEGLRHASRLTLLNVSDTMIGAFGAVAIAKSLLPGLTLLKCGGNPIGVEGAEAVCAAVRRLGTIRKLTLRLCSIGDGGMRAVAACLDGRSSLRELNVSRNKAGAVGMGALAEALKRGARLRKLHFGKNAGGERLVDEAMEHNGWVIESDRCKPVIERNRAMHERARGSALTLLAIRRFKRSRLSGLPWELTALIARGIYSTRGELEVWGALAGGKR